MISKRGARRIVWLICAAFALCCVTAVGAYAEQTAGTPDKVKLIYFYENYCGSCHPEDEFYESFPQLSGHSVSEYDYAPHNVTLAHGMELFNATCDEYGIPEAERLLPMVILGDRYYPGTTSIQAALPADFIEADDDTSSLIYYLYVTACDDCTRAKAIIDALPESLEVTRGQYAFTSAVTVRAVNMGQELGVAQALFERYNVPESKRTAPIVFMGNRFISGADSIERMLNYYLNRGEAIGTPVIAGKQADLSALSWLGTITAGLVGGLNPCALSMLLFFLTVLASSKRNATGYAALYLSSKFVAYVLIGTVLLGVFQAFNPTWLPLAVKILLTVIGAVLIYLNVSDALAAGRQAFGDIKNQLPSGMRRHLHETIRSMLNARGWKLGVSVTLLGMLVACSEFLCAGQVYLATLLASIQAGIAPLRMFAMLLCYCAAFLLPSVLLTLLVARGKTMNSISLWLSEHMALTKWLTAAVFVVIIIVIWL